MKTTLVSSEIAEPYAQALMSVAQSQNLAEAFGNDFRSLENLLEESQELRDFITNPVLPEAQKKNILRQIMGADTNPYLLNFLMLLVDKRRLVFLREIVGQYLNLLRAYNNTALAEVISAKELNDGQRQEVIARVKAISQAQNVELKTKIDPEIIGGVIIKVGSKILDVSLRGQLRRIGISLGN